MNNIKLILLLVLTILLGFLFYVLKYLQLKEKFQASLVNLNETDTCYFIPWGFSRQGCINRCNSDDKIYWGGDACDKANCRKICDNCEDPNLCKWQKTETRQAPVIVEQMPPKCEIRVVPGDSEAIVFWENINNDSNKNTVFIIKWFKTYSIEDGVSIETIDIENPDKRNYRYTIKGLQNNETYSVAVFSANTHAVSEPSNIELVRPSVNDKIHYPE